MTSILSTLRQTPQPAPVQFLGWNAGCWIQYFDDTDAKDPAKELAVRSFDPAFAARKQRDRCAVCYSLQAFGETCTKEGLLCVRNMGLDVDLVTVGERQRVPREEIERRKEEYLGCRLLLFPLKPHWLVETRHGFHVVFRIRPLRQDADIREAVAVNRRLAAALGGDENAVLLTQVFRVPGTIQFKNPSSLFLCQLLVDNANVSAPYDFREVARVLGNWERTHGLCGRREGDPGEPSAGGVKHVCPRQDGLKGQRNGRVSTSGASAANPVRAGDGVGTGLGMNTRTDKADGFPSGAAPAPSPSRPC